MGACAFGGFAWLAWRKLSILPKLQPDPEPRPEDDPFNNSREYRKDYKPDRSSPVQVDK